MKFQMMSTFWGAMHFEWWKRGCFKTLAFRKNKKAIIENCSVWNINTEEKNFQAIEKLVAENFQGLEIKLNSTDHLRRYTDHLQSALVNQMESCVRAKERFLFAPPDTCFGDGTIKSLMAIGKDDKSCVAVAHPRVVPDFFQELDYVDVGSAKSWGASLENSYLVSRAWRYLHQSWEDAEVGHPRQNGKSGGVWWSKIGEGLYRIQHALPTVYFADFTEQDLQYFQLCTGFGNYDHLWPAEILVPQDRQQFVGSSDACFIVEITEKLKNIPPVWPGNPNEFWKNHAHNKQNRATSVIFRGA